MIGRYLERRYPPAFHYRLQRLRGFGACEAIILIIAHRVCGASLYWYPKRQREQMRTEHIASA